jgi:hypothetical protein
MIDIYENEIHFDSVSIQAFSFFAIFSNDRVNSRLTFKASTIYIDDYLVNKYHKIEILNSRKVTIEPPAKVTMNDESV